MQKTITLANGTSQYMFNEFLNWRVCTFQDSCCHWLWMVHILLVISWHMAFLRVLPLQIALIFTFLAFVWLGTGFAAMLSFWEGTSRCWQPAAAVKFFIASVLCPPICFLRGWATLCLDFNYMFLNLKQMLSWLLSFVRSFSVCIIYKAGKRQAICCLTLWGKQKGKEGETRQRERITRTLEE